MKGKFKREKRKKLREHNTAQLRELLSSHPCVEVIEFSPIHLRVVANQQVDFWPSTGRAWVMGEQESITDCSAQKVLHLALDVSQEMRVASPA